MAEYAELVEQALIEIDELRHSIEYETDSDPRAATFLVPLEAELKRLQEALATGEYAFRDEDLPFDQSMSRALFEHLPFKYLLDTINVTHRSGLEDAD